MITLDDLDQAINGKAIITRMGREIPLKMGPKGRAEYRRFVAQGWGIDSSGGGTRTEFRAYEKHCDIVNAPVVCVWYRGRYAGVSVDMILTGTRLTEDGILALIAAYREAGAKKVYPGSINSFSHQVPKDQAEALAGAIAAIVGDKQNWEKKHDQG